MPKDMIPLDVNFDEEMRNEEMVREDKPKYPPGLKLYLDEVTLGKLGINKLPEIGMAISFVAEAEAVEISEEDGRKKLSLQITSMRIRKDEVEETVNAFYGE